MAYTARNWLLGKDLSALNVYSGTRASDGTMTWSSASSLLNRVDYVRISDDRALDMIASVDAIFAHYEKTIMDFTLTVGEILTKGATNILPGMAAGTDYVKVVFTRGSQTYTFLGIIQSFQDGVTAMGKNAVELTLKPIDLGSTSTPLVLS
jgi:hypothetical protein